MINDINLSKVLQDEFKEINGEQSEQFQAKILTNSQWS
jgi:hypothetical protein